MQNEKTEHEHSFSAFNFFIKKRKSTIQFHDLKIFARLTHQIIPYVANE